MERLDALCVRETNGKSYFTKIGAAFPNKNGDGYTLVLDALPVPNKDGDVRVLLKAQKPRNDRAGGEVPWQTGIQQRVPRRGNTRD